MCGVLALGAIRVPEVGLDLGALPAGPFADRLDPLERPVLGVAVHPAHYTVGQTPDPLGHVLGQLLPHLGVPALVAEPEGDPHDLRGSHVRPHSRELGAGREEQGDGEHVMA